MMYIFLSVSVVSVLLARILHGTVELVPKLGAAWFILLIWLDGSSRMVSGIVVGLASYSGVYCGVKLRRLKRRLATASVWRRGR
jgi:hypothetical protein